MYSQVLTNYSVLFFLKRYHVKQEWVSPAPLVHQDCRPSIYTGRKETLSRLSQRKSHVLQHILNHHNMAVSSILSSSWAHLANKTVPTLQMSLMPLAIFTALSSLQIYLPDDYSCFTMQSKDNSVRKISWCLEALALHAAFSHIPSCLM